MKNEVLEFFINNSKFFDILFIAYKDKEFESNYSMQTDSNVYDINKLKNCNIGIIEVIVKKEYDISNERLGFRFYFDKDFEQFNIGFGFSIYPWHKAKSVFYRKLDSIDSKQLDEHFKYLHKSLVQKLVFNLDLLNHFDI